MGGSPAMTSRLRRPAAVALLLAAALTLSACSGFRDSRLNPRNWFGRSQPQETVAAETIPADPRSLVDQVTEMSIERMAGGAIVRAAGLPPTQGWWNAELVAENDGRAVDGVMTYRFVIAPPTGPRRVSTPQSREVTAAVFLSDIGLADVSRIVVQGERNARTARR